MKSYNAPKQRRPNQAAASREPSAHQGTRRSSPLRGGPENALQQKVARDLNRAPRAQSLVDLEKAFNRSPKVTAQAKLAETFKGQNSALQGHAVQEKENLVSEPAAAAQRQVGQTSLPGALKTGIEGLSGLAMDDVEVHYNSPRPAQLHALAYAQGTDIHLAPGQEKHLPHEAWHIAQQKQGRVKPTMQMQGTAINDDSTLEREADVMGTKASRARRSTQRQESGKTSVRASRQGMVQRTVKVAGMEQTDVDALMTEMTKAAAAQKDEATVAKLNALEPYIRRKLDQWVQPPQHGSRKAQFRYYDSYYELALAVVGQVESTDNRTREKQLAIMTVESKYINAQLKGVCTRLLGKIIKSEPLVKNMLQGPHGVYGKHFGLDPTLDLLAEAAMNDKVSVPSFIRMIIAIHDVTDRRLVQEQLETKGFENEARTNTARKELSKDTRAARENKMPVEAGLSHTTNRMMALAKWAGAGTNELEAVAWGIFAFWKLFYDKTITGKHTFDEVMAVANMYGVPYTRYHYPSGPPPNAWARGPLFAARHATSPPEKFVSKAKL
ncbi:MAG TPA: DUF4157 domain-containing protein [Candidatus Angelobacter sp.]